jgi:hypothetical protein
MNEVSINKNMKLSEHLASPSEAALSQTNELDGLRLSPHFTLGELTKTSYHTLDGNIPSRVAIENLKRICGWLEILRERYNMRYGDGISPPEIGGVRGGLSKGQFEGDQTTPSCGHPIPEQSSPTRSLSYSGGEIPIVISSGYRSEEVNMKCGGAKGSNHLTGCAVDIRCYGPEQMIRMAGILLDIADGTKQEFDELIQEQRGTTYWIHFAVRPKNNRRKILFDCR